MKYLNNAWLDFLKFETYGQLTKQNFTNVSTEDNLQWKTSSIIKSEKSQQLLVDSSSISKLMLKWPNQILQMFYVKTTATNIKSDWLDLHLLSFWS